MPTPLYQDQLLVNSDQLAGLLSVTRQHVYRLIKLGQFPPPIKLGGASRWSVKEVEYWIDEQRRAEAA